MYLTNQQQIIKIDQCKREVLSEILKPVENNGLFGIKI